MIDFRNLKKPYLIAEIGINHNGDLQLAKKLIDGAHACSWDCVKFQKKNLDVCVPEDQKNLPKDTPWGRTTYLEYKRRFEFGKKEYDYIARYCRQKPIDWTASVWDLDSLNFIKKYDIPFIKIPSAHLINHKLIKASAQTGIPIVASTGMSTLKEIDEAVAIFKKHASQFVLMHCNSAYPAKLDELNLKVIPMLQKRYKCPIGYSGHEFGLATTSMAIVLGAKVIERHITLDHTMWGTDQSASIEITGMDKFSKQVTDVVLALGDGKKRVYETELAVMKKLRGS